MAAEVVQELGLEARGRAWQVQVLTGMCIAADDGVWLGSWWASRTLMLHRGKRHRKSGCVAGSESVNGSSLRYQVGLTCTGHCFADKAMTMTERRARATTDHGKQSSRRCRRGDCRWLLPGKGRFQDFMIMGVRERNELLERLSRMRQDAMRVHGAQVVPSVVGCNGGALALFLLALPFGSQHGLRRLLCLGHVAFAFAS